MSSSGLNAFMFKFDIDIWHLDEYLSIGGKTLFMFPNFFLGTETYNISKYRMYNFHNTSLNMEGSSARTMVFV